MIPALNEAGTIEAVVVTAAKHGTPIVVDDGSHDGTGARAVQAGAEVVRHDVNLGYDRAINSGFERAAELGCDVVITVDADGQHDQSIVQSFLDAFNDGADVVAGVRDRRQRFGEHVFSWVGSVRWGLHDPLCGMKGYRMTVWRALGHFDSYRSIGTELAIFAASKGMRVVELPVRTRDREDVPRFGRRIRANISILRALAIALIRAKRPPPNLPARDQG